MKHEEIERLARYFTEHIDDATLQQTTLGYACLQLLEEGTALLSAAKIGLEYVPEGATVARNKISAAIDKWED